MKMCILKILVIGITTSIPVVSIDLSAAEDPNAIKLVPDQDQSTPKKAAETYYKARITGDLLELLGPVKQDKNKELRRALEIKVFVRTLRRNAKIWSRK